MFQGFSDATVDFMWGIRFNNEKSWFLEHKEEFQTHFQRPMKELAAEVFDFLNGKYPDQGLTCKVSRIYRDARRLRGRGPYRDCLWFSMEQPGDFWTARPTVWFELSPEGASWGLGYYMAKPLTMAKLRARMDANPAPMEDLTRALADRPQFRLEGEEYKKAKPACSDLLFPWYQKKSFVLRHDEGISAALYDHSLVERLQADFDFLMPFYAYFVTLDGDRDPREH